MIFRSAFFTALIVFAPVTASAQHAPNRFNHGASRFVVTTQISAPSVRNDLLSVRTAAALLGFTLLLPVDETISRALRDSTLQQNRALDFSKDVMNAYGSPGVLVMSVGALAGGAIGRSNGLRDAGLHATEAIVVSGIVTAVIKEVAGRMRPNASPDDPFDFTFAGGFTGKGGRSLPSGHATAAFAFGVAIAEELEFRHPEVARYTTPAAYTLSVLTGLARIYNQKHWPSDVFLGAAIGTLSARIITKHAHPKTTN